MIELSEFELRALRLLVEHGAGGLLRPGYFGELLWPSRYHGSACSAPYARGAGKVLGRLRGKRYAEWIMRGDDWGWRATPAGRARCARGFKTSAHT